MTDDAHRFRQTSNRTVQNHINHPLDKKEAAGVSLDLSPAEICGQFVDGMLTTIIRDREVGGFESSRPDHEDSLRMISTVF